MNNPETESVWSRKGATFSDKSARKELGLTQEEIIKAINRGELHYRVNSVYGNPFLRLIRGEVEALVTKKHGRGHLEQKKIQTELNRIEGNLRLLKRQAAQLEARKTELLASLGRIQRRHRHRTTETGQAARKRARDGR